MNDKIDKSSLITIRPGEFDDLNFIFSTWLKGLRWGSKFHKDLDQEVYFKGQHRVIEKVIENPATEIRVACLKDTPEVIIGYSVVTDATTLHFVFCKKDWRNIGLAKDLVPNSVAEVSVVTTVGAAILKRHSNIVHNPYQEP